MPSTRGPPGLQAHASSGWPRPRRRAPAVQRPRSEPTAPSRRPRSWSSHPMWTSSTSARPTICTSRSPSRRSRPASTSSARSRSRSTARARSGSPTPRPTASRIAAVPFVYRYYPTVREARERVRAGVAGPVRLLHGSYLQDWLLRPEDDNWRVDAELGGASRAFADIGSHWCDLAEFVSGHRITRLSARTLTALPERFQSEAHAAFAVRQRPRRGTPGRHRGRRAGAVRDRRRRGRLDRDQPDLGRPQEPAAGWSSTVGRRHSSSARRSRSRCGSAAARPRP